MIETARDRIGPFVSLARRQLRYPEQLRRSRAFTARSRVVPRDDLVMLGTPYGGWTIPSGALGPGSICYLAGVGEDITFDLALIARFGCEVHALDPVPRAQRYAEASTPHEPRFHFHPVGLWSRDETIRFYVPHDPTYVSHSATNIHATEDFFEAPVRALDSLMGELGHDHLDLLKISAEGSEYEIVRHVLDIGARVGVLCVEFAQPAPEGEADRAYDALIAGGYELTHTRIDPWNWKLTFINPAVLGSR